jgi:hypothetical protein
MPITIQELIPSDTISQAVNKINFNFDQLLLNGGGPVGPAGPIGPTGPVGGRGLRGATWYHDPAIAPGTDPNTIIIATVEENDYYLQANGDVWEYNGTVWILTSVNLTGPQGSAGSSFGFNYAGGYPGSGSINNQNVAYIAPMPGGTSSGAVQGTNEAVSVAVFGGVATTAVAPSGISFTNAFLIPDVMVKSLDTSVLSVLVHQKDSSAAAIKFMGGGAIAGENYEQTVFGNLSDISLGLDDALNINVPKAATSPLSVSDLIGFNVNTLKRGQQYYAGKHINFISGVDTTPTGLGSEISDITFTVGTSNTSTPAKFAVSTTFGSASALFEIGGNITVPTSVTTKTGTSLIEANNIVNWGNTILMASASNNRIRVDATGILLNSSIAPITISTTGQTIDVSAGTVLNLLGATINITSAVTGTVNIGTGGSNLIELEQSTATHSIRLDNTNVLSGGTKIKGNLTWGVSSYATPYTTTRHIAIIADGLAKNKPPIYVIRNDASVSPTGDSMASFSKNSAGSAIEQVIISTAGVTAANYSGNAGFAGFHAINNHVAGLANFGVKVSAYDTVSGVYGDKFHASENTTAVSNRFQYVRKYLKIDPMTQGLTSGTGYTIPSTYMDASFLDIHVGSFSGTGGVAGTYHNYFPLTIPDGLYPGQRLQLHVVVQPGRHYDGGVQYDWPSSGGGPSGTVGINVLSFANTTSEVIASPSCSEWNASPSVYGGELFAELLWIGQTYITQWETLSGITNKTSDRGWIITNVAQVNYPGPYAFEDTATTTLDVT